MSKEEEALAQAALAREEAEQRKRDFSMCFSGPSGQRVLMYLNRLCNASKSSIVLDNNQAVDINHTLVNEGKRQVFLEILAFLNLTPEQIFMLRFGVPYPTGEMQNA